MNGAQELESTAQRNAWIGVIALAVGIFAMVTVEELPIGVLTLISRDLDAREGLVGLGVTLTGLVAAVLGLSTSMIIGRLDRRLVLVTALLIVAAATAATGAAPTIGIYLVARLFVGMGIGVFWALIVVVASRIVEPERSALATTVAFTGASGATILGVPLGTWLGTTWTWHTAFYVMAAVCLFTACGVWFFVPSLHVADRFTWADYGRAWSIGPVRLALWVTGVLVISHFCAYTYASPALQSFAHVTPAGVGVMLLAMGAAGLVGNLGSAPVMKRRPLFALLLVTAGMICGMALLMVSGSRAVALPAMVIWGVFGGAMSVVLQYWVMRSAGDVAEPAAALSSGVYNFAIASGAALGGAVLSATNISGVFVVSVVGVAIGAGILLAYRRRVGAGAD